VGTTSSKAVVLDTDGRELSHGHAPTTWESAAGRTEIQAAVLLDGALAAVRGALSGAPRDEVLGLGVASISECGVLLGRDGSVLGPVIAWHDTRDTAEVADLGRVLGADRFARHTGLPLRSQWSLTKHRWLRAHAPAAGDAARRLSVAEWIVRRLGGDEASEQSLASRTGWLDIGRRDWWPEALEWTGIRASLLPPVVAAGTALGTVSARTVSPGPPSADAVPAAEGAVLTVAGHDHQAAAIGAGATGAGDELDSCGTAEALVRTIPAGLGAGPTLELTRAGITVGWHAVPGHWCLLGATEGGLAMQRFLDQAGVDRADVPALDTAPWRAVVTKGQQEAMALHDAMTAVAGRHRKLIAVGGWLRSAAFADVKEQFFGRAWRPLVEEAGARGAALTAGVAAGVYPDFPHLPAPEYQ
jgi:sugar (pentulose or hexulose) kinase